MSSVNLVLILLAGGIGTRINRKISKQMIKYNNLTILEVNIINFSKIFKNIYNNCLYFKRFGDKYE